MRFLAIALVAVNVVSAIPVCKPGDTRSQNYTVCICIDDGTAWECSLVQTVPKPRERRQTVPQVCQPNDLKMKDLNVCYCLKDGSAWMCNSVSNSPLRKRRYSVQTKLTSALFS